MDRLDAYTYGCSIYEELRLMFIDLGLTTDINNYIGNNRRSYESDLAALNPVTLSKGIMLYPLGDFNYKVTKVNSVFINFLEDKDMQQQPYLTDRNGIRSDIYFRINVLGRNYKDAEYITRLIHSKFYSHSGHKTYNLNTNQFSDEYFYSVSSFNNEVTKLNKADLDHFREYTIEIGLHKVPILFPVNSTNPPVEYGVFQQLITYIDINKNGYYDMILGE